MNQLLDSSGRHTPKSVDTRITESVDTWITQDSWGTVRSDVAMVSKVDLVMIRVPVHSRGRPL